MHINVHDNKLILTFRFSPSILAVIKTIPGRRFDLAKKHWEIPVSCAAECVARLAPLGFTISQEVQALVESDQEAVRNVEAIKVSPAAYAGDLPLFDFQKIGVAFLKALPAALLADVPGLGKTIQTIAALEGLDDVLVLVPASLKYSWAEEIRKWHPKTPVYVIDGLPDTRKAQWMMKQGWKVANYELLLRDFGDINTRVWDAIVCDEAQRISNPLAKTTKLLKKLKTKKKIALSGTPISNSPEDIFSIIDWLMPGYLGSYWGFLEEYCIRDPRFNRVVGYKNLTLLGERISRFMLRRTKEEVLKDMPSKTIEQVVFNLSTQEMTLYNAVRKQIATELRDLDTDFRSLNLIPVKMLRLKQVTDHPELIGAKKGHPSSKFEVLKDLLIPILDSGEKAIIFTQFAEMAKLLKTLLEAVIPPKTYCGIIYGDISAEARQEVVRSFTDHKGAGIVVMTEAGAYGLNLQAASYVVNYDLPWSVAKYEQRIGRAHRVGQTKPVTVYNLLAKNTIDLYTINVLYKKQIISDSILGDTERFREAGISEEDIKNILGLKK